MSSIRKMTTIALDELDRLKAKQLSSFKPELRTMVFLKDEMDDILNRNDLDSTSKLALFTAAEHRFNLLKPDMMHLSTIPSHSFPAPPAKVVASIEQVPATSLAQIAAEQEIKRAFESAKPMKIEPVMPAARDLIGESAKPPITMHQPATSSSSFAIKTPARLPNQEVLKNVSQRFMPKAKKMMNFLNENKEKIDWDDKGHLVLDGRLVPNSNIKQVFHDLYVNKPTAPESSLAFQRALHESNVPLDLISSNSALFTLKQLANYPRTSLKSGKSANQKRSRSHSQHGRGLPPGKRPRLLFVYK